MATLTSLARLRTEDRANLAQEVASVRSTPPATDVGLLLRQRQLVVAEPPPATDQVEPNGPVHIGWTIAAGASVGDLIGDPAHHTIDVFAVDGYLVEREDIDGTVTETVTAPDGSVVDPAEAPSNVAAEIAS